MGYRRLGCPICKCRKKSGKILSRVGYITIGKIKFGNKNACGKVIRFSVFKYNVIPGSWPGSGGSRELYYEGHF